MDDPTEQIGILNQKERISLAVQVAAGMLASGHYSRLPEDGDEVELLSYDCGEQWKEEGLPRRHQRHVILDALDVVRDIEHVVRENYEDSGSWRA